MLLGELNIKIILLGEKLGRKDKASFWGSVKRSSSRQTTQCPVVDGLTSAHNVCEHFRSKLTSTLLEMHMMEKPSLMTWTILSQRKILLLSPSHTRWFKRLLRNWAEINLTTHLSSNHLLLASPVITNFLTLLFTVILCHGYMPSALRDWVCTLVPIPKPHCQIATDLLHLHLTLELMQYPHCFVTSYLKFGVFQHLYVRQFSRILSPSISIVAHRMRVKPFMG